MHMSARRLEQPSIWGKARRFAVRWRLSGYRSVAGVYDVKTLSPGGVHGIAQPVERGGVAIRRRPPIRTRLREAELGNSGRIPTFFGAKGVSIETHRDLFVVAGWLNSLCAGVWSGRAVPAHAAATCDAAALPPVRVTEHASNTERRAARSGFEASKATGLDCA
jgi:hypothetical protein